MERKNFLKNLCGYGMCSCFGFSLLSTDSAVAQEEDKSPELKNCEWKWGFTHKRFNWLLQLVEREMDTETYSKILFELGEKCAETIEHMATVNRGNPEGYFNTVNQKWGEIFNYDKENQIVYMDNKASKCPCPHVEIGKTPESYCDCSLGWQKHMFEILFDKPVEVSHTETILRGGNSCKFVIKVKA